MLNEEADYNDYGYKEVFGCYSKSHFWTRLDKNEGFHLCSDSEISNNDSQWDQKVAVPLGSTELKNLQHHVNS